MSGELPLLLRVAHVAAELDVSKRAAYRAMASGKCGAVTRIGGVLRIRRDKFLAAMAGEPPQNGRGR